MYEIIFILQTISTKLSSFFLLLIVLRMFVWPSITILLAAVALWQGTRHMKHRNAPHSDVLRYALQYPP